MKKIAIVRDRTGFWKVYQEILEKRGFSVSSFDIWKHGAQQQLLAEPFDAFIWRAKHSPRIKQLAQRLLYFFETEKGLPVFPDWKSFWHYDDKVSQYYILKSAGIRIPETHVFFDKTDALDFIDNADYPLVYKCAYGAGSSNVGIFNRPGPARRYVRKAFGRGLKTFFRDEIQKNYVLFQRFIPENGGDYRVVCVGDNIVSGFFRENREDAALASGSGKFDLGDLPADLLDFISDAHRKLGYDIMSYDLLYEPGQGWVITEMSVIYGDLSHTVYDDARVYEKQADNTWQKIIPVLNRHEMLIDIYLRKWGWA
ncbi:hypothetical protein KAH55_10010 [bacterium]|nr:hypothetical protein [bacterium]